MERKWEKWMLGVCSCLPFFIALELTRRVHGWAKEVEPSLGKEMVIENLWLSVLLIFASVLGGILRKNSPYADEYYKYPYEFQVLMGLYALGLILICYFSIPFII